MHSTIFQKRISLLLALALVFQCCIFMPFSADAATSAQADGRVNLGDGIVSYHQELKDNGDGTFSLTLVLEDASSVQDVSESETESKNGFFTAPADGQYQVELWGGNGASGNASNYGEGGKGGEGGYVYGIVTLKKGETLFYQLGGNGQQTTSEESGGGANGDGGNAGASTTYTVGGGGGYSAVYLFPAGEFESKYLDNDGNLLVNFISEEDRTTKYIMIAGGGGGGGAGSGNILLRDDGNPPSGGIGGTIGKSASGTAADGGTFFAGGNGLTSGTSTAYTGKGATDVPGETMESIIGLIGIDWFAGLQPNDWVASYNTETPGGNGGAGNLRGGSGGAGYAGGSGGVQTEIIVPTNVGGGGGGSSYVASIVDYQSATPDQADHTHEHGGAIHITAISDGATNLFKDVSLTLTPSAYFQIGIDSELTPIMDGEEVVGYQTEEGWRIEGDSASGYTLSGLDLTSENKTVTLTFTPRTGFAGGNGVPLLDGNALSIKDSSQDEAPSTALNLDADCAKINVPLNFQAIGHNLMTNTPGTEFDTTDLYEDNVSGIDLNGWQYDFIDSVTSYKVYTSDWTEVTKDKVAPNTTTRYYVGYTVTPKTGSSALVGNAVNTSDIWATAIITVLADGSGVLNGNTVQYNKLLTYDSANQQYVLSFQADISPVPLTEEQVNATLAPLTSSAPSYEIKYSGYYFIQAWGGDGGKGANAILGSKQSTGGQGGSGGYVEGFVYLTAGTKLAITVGTNGENGSPDPATEANWGTVEADYGDAGGNTAVRSNDAIILIAGGGGGGGAAWRGLLDSGKAGFSGQSAYNCEIDLSGYAGSMSEITGDKSTTPWYDKSLDTTEKSATNGANGTSTNNAGGTAGSSIIGTAINSTDGHPAPTKFNTSTIANDYSSSEDTNAAGGMVKITCLELTDTAVPATDMTNYVFQTELTEYFTINSVTCTDNKTNGALSVGELSYDNNQVVVTNITPTEVSNVASFTIDIAFVPRTGFAGGNDVPVLLKGNADGLNLESGMRLRQKVADTDNYININVNGQEATDFANVVLNTDSIGSISVTDPGLRTIDQDAVPIVGIAPSAMFTWEDEPILGADDWRYDYVTTFSSLVKKGDTTELIGSTHIRPNPLISTMYTATVGIKPTVETAQKAVVVNSVSPVSKSQDVEIIVIPRIKYELTNMETSDPLDEVGGNYYYTIKAPDKDYYAKLSASQGYQLPNTIEVYANDGVTPITNQVEYDPVTGIITIPADLLIGTVTVRAVGVAKKYSITFYRQNNLVDPPEKIVTDPDTGTKYEFVPGESLAGMNLPDEPDAIPGYTFQWDWGEWDPTCNTDGDPAPEIMPNQSIVVIGTYVPNSYPLTINYYKVDTTEKLRDSDTVQVPYTTTYTVNAPEISGYLADKLSQDVVMNSTGGVELNIYYTPTAGKLNIIYQYSNGKVAPVTSTYDIQTDTPYSYVTPVVDGYTADILSVTGTASADDVANGITVTVTYTPNTYTVTYNANGGSVTPGSMTVEYDNVYNYDASSKTMAGLPTPVLPGYTFACWYKDANGNGTYDAGEEIDGADTVTGDATLIAHWTVNQGRVVLILVDKNGDRVYYTYTDDEGNEITTSTKVYEGQVDTECQFTAPTVADYVVVSNGTGTRTYTNTTQYVYVTYRYTIHTLTIQYLFQNGTEAAASHTSIFREGQVPYTVDSPVYNEGPPKEHEELNGYKPNMLSYTNDCTSTTDITITVYYTQQGQADVVSVTVTWGELVFTYDYGTWNPETHQYDNPDIQPKTNLENYVTVKSNPETNIPVNVAVSYSSNPAYPNLMGFYTVQPDILKQEIEEWTLTTGESKTVYFWLYGYLPPELTGDFPVGTCTVTITAGG